MGDGDTATVTRIIGDSVIVNVEKPRDMPIFSKFQELGFTKHPSVRE